jgi:hypothetical protein
MGQSSFKLSKKIGAFPARKHCNNTYLATSKWQKLGM